MSLGRVYGLGYIYLRLLSFYASKILVTLFLYNAIKTFLLIYT